MMISYDPGSVVLERMWQRGVLGQTRLLVLFLGSEYDRDFLVEVIRYGHDLDNLLHGKFCIGLLFMPPPPERREQHRAVERFKRFHELPWRDDPELTEQLVRRMSAESYNLARLLSIPLQDLPGIAFLSASEPDAVAFIPLAHSPLTQIYPDLRRVMSKWYEDNRQTFERYKADLQFAQNEQVASFARQVQIEIGRSGKAAHLVKKLPHAIGRAEEDPSNIRNLMVRHGLSVELSGVSLDGHAIEKRIIELKSRTSSTASPLPDFDLDRVRRVSRKIQLEHAVSVGAERGKGILEWIKLLRETLSPL